MMRMQPPVLGCVSIADLKPPQPNFMLSIACQCVATFLPNSATDQRTRKWLSVTLFCLTGKPGLTAWFLPLEEKQHGHLWPLCGGGGVYLLALGKSAILKLIFQNVPLDILVVTFGLLEQCSEFIPCLLHKCAISHSDLGAITDR